MANIKTKATLLRLINQVRDNMGFDPIVQISPQMRFKEDLEVDSMSLEELVVYVEETMNVELDIEKIKTVEDVLKSL